MSKDYVPKDGTHKDTASAPALTKDPATEEYTAKDPMAKDPSPIKKPESWLPGLPQPGAYCCGHQGPAKKKAFVVKEDGATVTKALLFCWPHLEEGRAQAQAPRQV